ncbi:MAG: hypothetical protein GX916_02730 [Clostridiales bacterium]|jgi:hypothetical protein|nr:hypothetical protein [Clostridiales bacterium]
MSGRNSKGFAPRSRVANKLLGLSEQVEDQGVRDALRQLERQALSGPVGSDQHNSFAQLNDMLDGALPILTDGSAAQRSDYLRRLEEQLSVWQRAQDGKEIKKMSFFDRFSKSKRERHRKDQLIEKLQANIFQLEQRHESLAAAVTSLEGKRDEQVQIASGEAPGSPRYNTAKGRHTLLSAQLKSKMFEAQAVAKVLATNQSYLAGLLSERDISDLGTLMPVSMEAMEMDLEQSNVLIEEEVEKLKLGLDIVEDINQERDRIYESLADDQVESDFDKAVSTKREGDLMLDQFRLQNEKASDGATPAEKRGKEEDIQP